MEKITITRALNEIKLLDKRINKSIDAIRFVDYYQERDKKGFFSKKSLSEFNNDSISEFQSINDLIEYRKKIKSLILESNAQTNVKIDNIVYTVVEAIERKNSIKYDKQLLEKMKEQNTFVISKIEEFRSKLDIQVEQMLLANLGTDKKSNKEDYENISKPFIEKNELKFMDPLKIQDKIKELEIKIDNFLNEVDFILSESNAKTYIEI